uniref:Uncharacterized protein n=1 Tax=Siphoviridae sp. ctTDf8 TaxID=2825517 RepID=A0A8S5UJ52_9CAUD|nr:MAG TPA: hypothetical protein [Siphoviridae sp. ctTDf8]
MSEWINAKDKQPKSVRQTVLCVWKNGIGTKLICVECFRSDPDGLRTLLDDFNRLGRQIKTKEGENGGVDQH